MVNFHFLTEAAATDSLTRLRTRLKRSRKRSSISTNLEPLMIAPMMKKIQVVHGNSFGGPKSPYLLQLHRLIPRQYTLPQKWCERRQSLIKFLAFIELHLLRFLVSALLKRPLHYDQNHYCTSRKPLHQPRKIKPLS